MRPAILFATLLLLVALPAAASTGADLRLEPAPVNRLDVESLQRGARTFVNYCLNCHSARYMERPVDDIHLLLTRQPYEVNGVTRHTNGKIRILLRVIHCVL